MISVFVKNLSFDTIIGVLDFERYTKQKVKISANLNADEFIDYAELCQYFIDKFNEKQFLKVEDALNFFKTDLKAKFATLKRIKLKITKPQIIENSEVGATLKYTY